ncbi:MAG: flagellar biosynthesis protein FlhB [Rhodothalassiaceae bacterium]
MAENDDQDDAQKTEEPTQRKLEEAAKKGDLPQSQEIKHWMMLVAGALAFLTTGSYTARMVTGETAGFIAHAHEIPVDPQGLLDVMREAGTQILLYMMLPLGILLVGALAGNLLQHKPVFTFEKVQPKLSKISPAAGFKRLFSMQRLVEFAKTLAKLLVVGLVVGLIVWPDRVLLTLLIHEPVERLTDTVVALSLKVLFGVIAAMTVIAALDLLFQRLDHLKKMRMTKQEVKDEHKQMEGDPLVRARLRQIRMEKAKKRMMATVPEADVVITNPTHYAVALKYRHGEMQVPVLVAKGVDEVALRIRKLAQEHDIPLVENPPLARALHAHVDLDEEIPPEHYQAVAEVISYVLRLRRGHRASYRPGM